MQALMLCQYAIFPRLCRASWCRQVVTAALGHRLIKEAKSMPKTKGAADPGEMYAQLIAERKERRAALVRGADLVDERERLLELKERVYASLSESFDLTDAESCPNKRGALVQQGTSLLNTYVKLMGLCDERSTGDQSAKPDKRAER
jgi:hypothetical protein